MRELLDGLHIWHILLITFAIVLVAIEAGFRIGRWRNRTVEFESEALLSSMTGAHLALLAFIMAFSFNMAAGHYAERRHVILEEVNAIETAYLRAQLLSEPEAEALVSLLGEYAAMRASYTNIEQARQMIAETDELHAQLWSVTRSIVDESEVNVLHSLFIQALNDVFDVHEKRVTSGLRNRVPISLWWVLISLLVLAMLGIGYFSGRKGRRNPIASTALAFSFSLVLFLIADLDRPTRGVVKSDLSVLAELDARLNR